LSHSTAHSHGLCRFPSTGTSNAPASSAPRVGTLTASGASNFERAGQFSAEGWHADGQWSFKGHKAYEGRRSAAASRPLSGDRLVSNSGMVLRPGEAITLTGYYRGSGLGVGIEVVGLLGMALATPETTELQPAEEWTEFSITYEPPADLPADGFAYARAYCEVLSDDAQGVFDSFKFDDDELPPPPKPKPKDDDQDAEPEEIPIPPPSPNLVPNPSFTGVNSPWRWSCFGADEQLGWRSVTYSCLTLTGGDAPAGWNAELDRMDISVPHVFSLRTDFSDTCVEPARAVLLVFNADHEKVYHHQILPLTPGQERLTALVPSVQKLPASGYGRLTVLVPDGFEGELRFSRPSLLADPHLPSISARQKFRIFSDPRKVSIFIRVPNRIDQITEMVTHLKFVNRAGVGLTYEKRKMAIGPRAVALFPAGARLKYNGAYKLVMRAQAPDGSRTFAYGEYPLVISPARPQDAKNLQFGVALNGAGTERVLAAATAGAGWVAVPLRYTSAPSSHEFRVHVRQLHDLGQRAHTYGVRLAVQIRFVADDVLCAEDFTGFFEAVNSALGSYADAYVLEVCPELLAAVDGYGQMAAITALIRKAQEAAPADVDSIIMAPFGSVVGIAAAAAAADKLLPDAGHDDAQPDAWLGPDAEPAADPEPVAAITQPEKALPQPELGPAYEALYVPDSERSGNWLLPMALAAGQGQRADIAPDALMVRQALAALAGDYDLVFWQDTGESAVLDDTGAATQCWVALWNMCSQLRGKEFVGSETTDGVHWVRFAGADEDTVVAWGERGKRIVTLSGDLRGVSKVDIGGAQWPLRSLAGRAKATLSTDPLYFGLSHGAQLTIEPAFFASGTE